ncbi:MAG: HRDC domain-containing protein [Verrucomicrobiota bacterium]|jgi:superfamily II DNA helicase RecQ
MQLKFFAVPTIDSLSMEDEVNQFIRSHQVVSIQREIAQQGSNIHWAICIEYQDGNQTFKKNRLDYKDILNGPDFALFCKLRDRRKELAEKEGIPVFAVCTNEQLADISRSRPVDLVQFKKIQGVGSGKLKKYGEEFIEVILAQEGLADEATGEPDREDRG